MSAVINDTDQLVQFLKNVKLFAELSPDSLAKLGTCLKTAEFPPAEVIVREGAPGVSMYIIKAGLVEVRKKDPATGIDFLVAQLSEGAAVGEMSLLTGKPRSATVTTVQPTVVFTLTRADFRNLLTQHPEISLGLARIMAERLEDRTKQKRQTRPILRRRPKTRRSCVSQITSWLWQSRKAPAIFISSRRRTASF